MGISRNTVDIQAWKVACKMLDSLKQVEAPGLSVNIKMFAANACTAVIPQTAPICYV